MRNEITRALLGISAACCLLLRCEEKKTLFRLLPPEKTGITFSNSLQISDTFNILTEEYIYNGGGVGIGDFNNDSLPDIFFTGNQVPNQLYLNKGHLKFVDVSREAGINIPRRWNSGVAVADINNDGWMDIYVCATLRKDSTDRRNMLFINKGLNPQGIPVFEDMAESFHLDDNGYSTMAAFVDYDRDGDLDLYVLTDQLLAQPPTNYHKKMIDGSSPNNDRLYRNNGDNTFTNVSKEAGISIEGFGLGLAVADLNQDGWPDFYVSNDYVSNDLLYLNNGDGTFKNRIAEYIGHTSHFSMGNDVADINNDGLPDILTLDMLPETNFRKKTTVNSKSYQTYINNEKYHYEYQYMRNMLQLNNGMGQGIKFSEIGQMSGIHQTEWSWSPLLSDFDNDGNKDLVVTNGFPMDVTDKDFSMYRAHSGQNATVRQLLDSIPVVKIPNYAFRNNGDLSFTDVTRSWGFDMPSFSNGAAFADLDNDGDLDYIVNNIDDAAFVYENTLYTEKTKAGANHYVRFRINFPGANPSGIGTKIELYYDSGKLQVQEFTPFRGYLSSVENIIHFGLGKSPVMDSVLITWPNGRRDKLKSVQGDQVIAISPTMDGGMPAPKPAKRQPGIVEPVTKRTNLLYRDEEVDKFDYNVQRTLPHKFTQSGPGLATGDVNGDGLEDVVVGGSAHHNETIFLQQPDGTFGKSEIKNPLKPEEDEGLLLFDADSDGDLDLYVVSGSFEDIYSKETYQDRLYINQGKGDFKRSMDALPAESVSGSCVRAADFDADGDLDLFVGGRVVLASYPLPAESMILRNDHGHFTNVTPIVCPALKSLGMITDALWTDFNGDGQSDLMVVGEFMPVTFFSNDGKKLTRVNISELDHQTGWWNSITAGDFDRDGDTDYVVGNFGNNNYYRVSEKFPLRIYGKDFDNNGSVDPVLACYMRENMQTDDRKMYAIHFWDELSTQSPMFRRKFKSYRQFGQTVAEEMFTPKELEGALILDATQLLSCYLENLGNGKFKSQPLPLMTQLAPINGMVSDDVDGDGNLDVVLVGNDYGNEIFSGRLDALTGLILLGDGTGSFKVVPSSKSGFYVPGDAKALVRVAGAVNTLYIATQNRDSIRAFERPARAGIEINPRLMDTWAKVIHADGKTERVEFYYGSGYLSQSSRSMTVRRDCKEILIFGPTGQTNKIIPLAPVAAQLVK